MYQYRWKKLVGGFAVGGIIWDLFWQAKRFKSGDGGGRWCQVLEGVFDALGVIEGIKSPCGARSSEGQPLKLEKQVLQGMDQMQ
jgi:hypothetical protein